MTEDKLNFDLLQDHYEPALSAFMNRIVKKHGEHGTSFLERSFEWMQGRARGEVIEHYRAGSEAKAIEALDVSICWFLIAQKYLMGQGKDDPAPIKYLSPSIEERVRELKGELDPEGEWLGIIAFDKKRYPEMRKVLDLVLKGLSEMKEQEDRLVIHDRSVKVSNSEDELSRRYPCPKCATECGPDDIHGCETLRCPKCGEVFEPEDQEKEQ